MKLKEAMQETGLTQKAIRYYEQQGLIQPIKQANGYKEYDTHTIQQLHYIKAFRDLQFSMAEVQILLNQEEQKQKVLLDKIRACEEQILRLDTMKTQLREILEKKEKSLCVINTKQGTLRTQYILITEPYAFFKKFHLVILTISILLVFLCFTTDTSILLSKWTDRMVFFYLIICALCEEKQKKKLQELAKDGYEEIQIPPQDILLEMCYAFLWNCSILWMIKIELTRAFALPTILCREGAGYVLLSMEISLLLIVKLYFSLKKWKRL